MKAGHNAEGYDFLDTLLLRHHITLKMVYDCAAARYEELKGMERILDLKDEEDVRRFLVLPRILVPDGADTIIAHFREETQKQESKRWVSVVSEPDIEKYAVLLISAFVYNTPFFAMAWKRCDLLKEAAYQKRSVTPIHEIASQPKRARRRESSYQFMYKAASAAVPGFRRFGTPFDFEEGRLEALGAEFDGYYLQFRFTPNAALIRLYIIDVQFTTSEDHVSHVLRLRNNPDGVFRSSPKDGKNIDYTQGIEVQSVEFKETEEDGNE
jgi:hypothetical protein